MLRVTPKPTLETGGSMREVRRRCGTRRRFVAVAGVLAGFLWVGPATGLEGEALRVDEPPVLDGVLDEAFWSRCPAYADFITFEPEYGKPASERTEVRFAYDEDAIYLGIVCADTDPSGISAHVTRRDARVIFEDDWVMFMIDPLVPGRGAVEVGMNPAGSQMDAWKTPGGNDDVSIDYDWDGAAHMNDQGWSAELAVPFKTLRFAAGETVAFKILSCRQIARLGEKSTFPAIDFSTPGVTASGLLLHFQGIRGGRIRQVLPSLTASSTGSLNSAGRMVQEPLDPDFGATLHLGLSTDLVLDATYNPDFSQVEADAPQLAVVNQRFPVWYPEKRPFFMEGVDAFRLACDGSLIQRGFYTRTVEAPQFGLKLTGSVSGGLSLGVLAARDELGADADLGGEAATVAVARPRYGFGSSSFFGAFLAARQRKDSRNQVGGVDFTVFPGGGIRFSVASLASHSRGLPWVSDSDSTGTLDGHAVSFHFSVGDGRGSADVALAEVSPGFRLSSGFVQRTGERKVGWYGHYAFYPQLPGVERLMVRLYGARYWDWDWCISEERIGLGSSVTFLGRNAMWGSVQLGHEAWSGRWFPRREWTLGAEGFPFGWLRLEAYLERAEAVYYETAERGWTWTHGLEATATPTRWLEISLDANHQRFLADDSGKRLYDVTAMRLLVNVQADRHLRFRAIADVDDFSGRRLLTDLLASYEWKPGSVAHAGYGSLFFDEDGKPLTEGGSFSGKEVNREIFLKIAYGFDF